MNDTKTSDIGNRTIQLVKWRIIPFAFILYFFNFMDRVNVGFAALQMNADLSIDPVYFGYITSVFFFAYLVFQVPSNIAILKFGARRWIGTIIIGWGSLTLLMFFAQNVTHIIIARFLLGVFEAGFFPGMIFYLSGWFPAKERAKVTALFMLAIPISSIIASPMSGWIVQNAHWVGHAGWRWLFMIEGIPTILLGCMTFFVFPDRPQEAKWLDQDQKSWLINVLETETREKQKNTAISDKMSDVLKSATLWRLVFAYMFVQAASQASNYWLPGQVKSFLVGMSDFQVGLIMAIPFFFAMIAMPVWSWLSDKTGERKWHAALPMLVAGIAFIVIGSFDSFAIKIVGMILFGLSIFSFYGPYWAIPSALLAPTSLAISIALINSGSSFGGFLAGLGLGHVNQAYGAFGVFMVQAVLCILSALILITMKVPRDQNKLSAKA